MANVAFLGLGVMGAPMAGHLTKAGHRVTVYNRTTTKAAAWVSQYGGTMAETPALASKAADVIFACVGADHDVQAVTTGPFGAFATMLPGSIFVDHTTIGANTSRQLAEIARERGIGFLDAPVSGGQAGAENGQLTIMVGGDKADYDKAEPVMQAYAKRIGHMGPSGAGQLTKMVNQICIAGVVQGLAEAVHFAMEAGLDSAQVFDVLSKGAAQSWQMENRTATMAAGKFDFGFAVDWMRKDLGLVLDEARRMGVTLPVTALVDHFYNDVQKLGGQRQDTSSLIRRFRR